MFRSALFLFVILPVLVLGLGANARADWTRIRSANFTLVGNAPVKDLRNVASRLEEFRETLRILAPSLNYHDPAPVNVIVFANDAAYRPFKPKRADGRIDQDVAGYFQSGEDANYITLSTTNDEDTFQTIFHEYVHFVVSNTFGRTEIPPWLNEGLAEYYQTVRIDNGTTAAVGAPRLPYSTLLNRSGLIPLEQLAQTTNAQLREMEPSRRRLFYGQSWAFVHYLLRDNGQERMDLLVRSLAIGTPDDVAFQKTVGLPFRQLDQELRNYIGRGQYNARIHQLTDRRSGMAGLPADAVSDAESESYLGDLLYHMQRDDEAELHLKAALTAEPASPLANKALGLLRLTQRNFPDARKFLEASLNAGLNSAVVNYRYADLIGRQDMDELGYVYRFRKENADKMRTALRRAIALDPAFVDAYERLAFVDMVNGEELEDALAALATAQKMEPNDRRLAMRSAEIFYKQHRYDDAQKVATDVARSDHDAELRQRASALLRNIDDLRASQQTAATVVKAFMATTVDVRPLQKELPAEERPFTDAELAKIDAENEMRATNVSLRLPDPGEERVIGKIDRINCRGLEITYSVKAANASLTLGSPDFKSVRVAIFRRNANRVRLDCGESLSAYNSVITYRPSIAAKQPGTLVSIEFVSDDFRFLSAEEAQFPAPRIIPMPTAPQPTGAPTEGSVMLPNVGGPGSAERQEALETIRNQLRVPAAGEVRSMGYLNGVECGQKGTTYRFTTLKGELRLRPAAGDSVPMRIFTPDLAALSLNCSTRLIDYPAVFIYRPGADGGGTVISIEFVPRSFSLVP